MDQQRKKNMTFGFVAFAGLHLLCCGIPLLLFAGVSFSFVSSVWPVAGALLFALGIIGFVWYLKRGCTACPSSEGIACSSKE